MNTHNAAVALLSDNLSSVLVRFKHSDGGLSPKQYSYLSTISLAAGDEAVVNSPYGGYKVVVVEDVRPASVDLTAEYDYKFIVQRVDKEADKARLAVVETIKQQITEQQRQAALRKLKKKLGLTKNSPLSKAVELLRKNLV